METIDRTTKSRLARTFAKVLHIRQATGVAPADEVHRKTTFREKFKHDVFDADDVDEKLRHKIAKEAFLSKLFATISTVKAAYSQLQFAQSPYDADGIQAADQIVISELKNLSELKQCYLKKQFDELSPEKTQLLAEIQEQKSLIKTYEVFGKKLDSELKLKYSEITFLKEKLEEANRESKVIEKRLNSSGLLSVGDNLHLSGLSPNHFISFLRQTTKSIQNFVRLMVNEMELAGWDLDAAVGAIEPGVRFSNPDHICFAFESFVCREMFDGFNNPNFSLWNESLPEQQKSHRFFFERFKRVKSMKTREILVQNLKSAFSRFCSTKYLKLVHPKMETSLFGNLNQRKLVKSGDHPETTFFATFSEMAKRVWLLHCLAFSFEPEASIFQAGKGCRFSEVYMESACEEAFFSSEGSTETDPLVAFTVVPGFKIGKTVIQCQVYLSSS